MCGAPCHPLSTGFQPHLYMDSFQGVGPHGATFSLRMAIFNGPPRAGSRGGRDQFNWEDVRGDKDASYYIGHSVKALSGRWQKGKDVYWYTREQKKEDASAGYDEELRAVKAHEEQLMAEVRFPRLRGMHYAINKHTTCVCHACAWP